MSDALPRTLARLKERFGDRFTTALAAREQHGRGEAHHPDALPDAVVFVASTEEVSDAVRICAAGPVPVTAFGAGTSLEGNALPVAGGVVLDTSGMDAILRVSTEDLDVTVQAGVTRKRLNSHLRDTGLFFPIDPGPDATIGGMAATRASGTNAVRYGTMRENVLSLTVVLADGRVIRTARRARKSAAGYDLTRLFVGSEGTLGIITEVTLRLHGIPAATTVASCTFAEVGDAVDTAIAVVQLGLPIGRMELVDTAQIAAINRYSRLELPVADTLFFEFSGSSASVAEQIETVRGLVADHGGADYRWAETPEERTRLWQARHDAYYATVALRPNAKGWPTDVCVPVSRLADCIRATKALLAGSTVPATILGHVGDGNFHVVFAVDPNDPGELAEVARLNSAIVALAIAADGTCTGEHGVGLGKRMYLDAEHGEALDAMRLIKSAFDPQGILNPGKILPDPPTRP
ncbi:FAD-binding oxidoreductase [Azospirillum endophyticum]